MITDEEIREAFFRMHRIPESFEAMRKLMERHREEIRRTSGSVFVPLHHAGACEQPDCDLRHSGVPPYPLHGGQGCIA